MTLVEFSRWTGAYTLLLLFLIKLFIAINDEAFRRAGRVAILWTSIWALFLVILRFLSALDIGTMDQRTIVAGFTTLIPLLMTVLHLFYNKDTKYTTPVSKPVVTVLKVKKIRKR